MKLKSKFNSRLLVIAAVLVTILCTGILALGCSKNDTNAKNTNNADTNSQDNKTEDVAKKKYVVESSNGERIEYKLVSEEEVTKESEKTSKFLEEKISKLSAEKKAELYKLDEEGSKAVGSYIRKKYEIMDVLPEGSRRVTLDEVKDIVSKYDYETALAEIYKIHGAEDYRGGSGLTRIEFWLDNEGTEMILIYYDSLETRVCYSGSSSESEILKTYAPQN